jgi:alkanesulfonate monooxygenase SsuD/methylene tetrahydromethanopterin reductase-like flavin-dependent oxidoreductase (luciferase family)
LDDIASYGSPAERAEVEHALKYSMVGSPNTVRAGLESFIDMTRADELMLTALIYDHAARLRSFELAAALREDMVEML